MPELAFRIKKRRDADALLVLVREDGTVTSNAIGAPAGYGPVHDLCHYVLETAWALSEGFLGLVASGWEISDFEIPGAAKLLPPEAALAESAAGELSRQAMMWQYSGAEDFVWAVRTVLEASPAAHALVPELTEAMYDEIRARILELRARWSEVPAGGTLELRFHSAVRSSCRRPSAAT